MWAKSVSSCLCLSIPRIIRASCFLLFCRLTMCSVKPLEFVSSVDRQWILWWVMQRSGAYSLNTMVGRNRLYSAMRSWTKSDLSFANAALETAHINHGIWNIRIVFICANSDELSAFRLSVADDEMNASLFLEVLQSWPIQFVLGWVIPPPGTGSRSRNLGQTFLDYSV